MPYVNSFDNTKIYYEITGDGFLFVLIIGLGGNSKAWAFQVPDFSKKYKIITIDNRGAGLSDKPDEYYSMKIFAKDIKAVLDNENIKNSYFLGLSMGGLILQEFYHSYPEYVKAMILGCTGPGDPGLIKQNPKVKEVLFSIEEKNYDNLIKERIKLFYHPSYLEKNSGIIEKIVELSKLQPIYAYKRQLEACILKEDELNAPRLKNIKVPVLVIHGDEDMVWDIENAYYLHKNIPNSKIEIIKNSGHMFFIEKYEEFNKKVLSFLDFIDNLNL